MNKTSRQEKKKKKGGGGERVDCHAPCVQNVSFRKVVQPHSVRLFIQTGHTNFDRNSFWTRALVAVEPRRPPVTNVGTETAFRHEECKHFQKKWTSLRSEVRGQLMRSKSCRSSTTVRICYSVGLWFLKIYHYNRCIIISDVHSLSPNREPLFLGWVYPWKIYKIPSSMGVEYFLSIFSL